ncbi:MAG TPA: hypothetical protein VFJ58_02515 [Armatimonadota bacterium]|nr:hypothetical protein [Armatimonadota bacterium]
MPSQDVRTPNEKLAKLIAAALIGEGIIPARYAGPLEQKLKSGTAKPEDWRFWIEDILPAKPEVEHE